MHLEVSVKRGECDVFAHDGAPFRSGKNNLLS
ncbi:hypothetical protein P3T25_005320 [Paraburkholderia sp. GAS32]|jgi:hypothetical protein